MSLPINLKSYDNLRMYLSASNLEGVFEFLNNFINSVFEYNTILKSLNYSDSKFDKKLVKIIIIHFILI